MYTQNLNKNLSCYYKTLIYLKRTFGIKAEIEKSFTQLFEEANKHNIDEYFLIQDLIKILQKAPKEIIEQNITLSNLYSTPNKYKKTLKELKTMYKEKRIFINFVNELNQEFQIFETINCKFINYWIFELGHTFLSDTVIIYPKSIHLNLHLLFKWMTEQQKLPTPSLMLLEEFIILHLANGYQTDNLIDSNLNDFGIEIEENIVKEIIEEKLPTKFNVETINQVMAVLYLKTPQISNYFYVEKRINQIKKLLIKGK